MFHGRTASITTFLVLILISRSVLAGDSTDDSVDTVTLVQSSSKDVCAPNCRPGFVCANGRCVSPCNPPCHADEICTRNGHCLPTVISGSSENTTASSSAQSSRSEVPPSSSTPGSSLDKAGTGDPNSPANTAQYQKFRKRRNVGTVLLTFGVILVLSAAATTIVGNLEGEEVLTYASLGIDSVGTPLLFSGMGLMIQGRKGMRKAKAGSYTSEDIQGNIKFKTINPTVMADAHLGSSGYGLAASLSF